ncbi:HXXEE domain-containing protein [Teratosphaeria destructans]|uniref:HXXEE domain-containing protein n=1 Tax=Teratosphaeria destructans TaxID=418781 RepID=A0A9W7W7S9_9PEZI|nr:HXXEE domain-containing protein [Teratosphaeria destructans]
MSPEIDNIIRQWPWISLTVGAMLAVQLLFGEWKTRKGPSDLRSFNSWRLRFEEWGYDIKGVPYSFHQSLCSNLGYPDTNHCPATPLPVFAVNGITMWIGAWSLRYVNPSAGGANYYGMVVFNSLTHIVRAILDQEYNAGLLSTLVNFVPASYFFYRSMLDNNLITRAGIVRSLILGFVGHVVWIAPYIWYAKGYMGEVAASSFQLLNTLMLNVVNVPI